MGNHCFRIWMKIGEPVNPHLLQHANGSFVWFVEEDVCDEPEATTSKSADKYDLGIKNVVMTLHELCAKKSIRLEPVVANKVNADGQVWFADHSVTVVLECKLCRFGVAACWKHTASGAGVNVAPYIHCGVGWLIVEMKRFIGWHHCFLWPPCIADADIIFSSCGFLFFLSVFSSPNRFTDVSRTITFPDRRFPDKSFPGQSLSRTITFPVRHFPDRCFPDKLY